LHPSLYQYQPLHHEVHDSYYSILVLLPLVSAQLQQLSARLRPTYIWKVTLLATYYSDTSTTMPPAPDAMDDIDAFFDWRGATNTNEPSMLDVKRSQAPILPISPLSATYHDFNFAAIQPHSLTASTIHDLPTPSHSSSSPETRSNSDLRLSGDTLRDETSPTNVRPLKRKISPNDIVPQREQMPPAAKKRPHNIIEKRYRANLNEKIAELRDSVPSLRSKKSKPRDGSGAESEDEDLDGLTPSNKLNKASILTKAVEYIRHLEFRTKRLEDENRSLKERLETLDKVIAQGGHDSQRTTAFTSSSVIEGGSSDRAASDEATPEQSESKPSLPVQGLIPIPDSWRRLRQSQTQSQEHYGHVYDSSSRRSLVKGKWPTRIMLGSLAGLMVMEGFAEHESDSDSGQKGLFGIPLELLDGWEFLRSPRIYLTAFSQFCRAGGIFPLVKGFMALTIAAFLIFAYLFNSKPPPKEDIEYDAVCADQAPGPASPIEVRRRAWSTSMQALGLPHHSFFPEWLALTEEWLKYCIRQVLGYSAYTWVTGRSQEDDMARIKAWDIAIDAQLAGGDLEVSRSRVVLTIFGSGTLPKTPSRLMQKALHCRVLLWNVGHRSRLPFKFFNAVGRYFAKKEWQQARRLHNQTASRDADRLPSNLAALLTMECDEIFTDTVMQRAYNLMYDRPTHDQAEDSLMDVVIDDHAVRSPLDAVAAWRSTATLREVLEASLDTATDQDSMQEKLTMALRIAPTGSAAQVRALAVQAVFGKANRGAYFSRASEMFCLHTPATSPHPEISSRGPFFIDSSTPASARSDLENCLLCAETLLEFEQSRDLEQAREVFRSRSLNRDQTTTVLTDAVLGYVLAALPQLGQFDSEVGLPLLRADSPIADCQMSPQFQKSSNRRRSMESNDTGYESLDEDMALDAWDARSLCEV
jgi:hypothetical protein